MSEEYDYYLVEVAKKSYTEVYIRVPKGEKVTYRDRKLIKDATVKTVTEYDWNDYRWEDDLEINTISSINEEEATGYIFYDAHDFKSS